MAWGIAQILFYLLVLTLLAKPLGLYMAHVFRRERTFMDPVVRPVERLVYRLCGVHEDREMGVVAYVLSLLAQGAITPHVAARIPLAEASRAMTLAESKTVYGKVVLVP